VDTDWPVKPAGLLDVRVWCLQPHIQVRSHMRDNNNKNKKIKRAPWC
jgi:hypothetical protein